MMRPQMGQNRPRPRRKAIRGSLLGPPNAPPRSSRSAKVDLHHRVAWPYWFDRRRRLDTFSSREKRCVGLRVMPVQHSAFGYLAG